MQGPMTDPTEVKLCIRLLSLSLTTAALPRLLLQSQVVSVLTTKGAGSTLHTTHFRYRSFSIKLWQHVRTFFLMTPAAVSTISCRHLYQQKALIMHFDFCMNVALSIHRDGKICRDPQPSLTPAQFAEEAEFAGVW